jgi:hypothetical protein
MLARAALALLILSLGPTTLVMLARLDWWVIPAALLGWFCADAASGLIHMTFDYLPCPKGVGLDTIYFYPGSRESEEYLTLRAAAMARINPFFRLVYDFKNHHPRPDALGRRDMMTQIGSSVMIGTLPMALALNLALLRWAVPGWALAFAITLLIGSSFAQYFHGTLHRQDNPWMVRALRRCHLLMTPQAHQKHHDSLRRDFATNCGWSNPFLNPLFRALNASGILLDAGLEP